MSLSALVKQRAAERARATAELDQRVEAALGAADELEGNVTALFGKELVQIGSNQRHLDFAVAHLQQSVAAQSKAYERFAAQYDALMTDMAEAGGVGDWLRTMEVGLNGTLSLLAVIEKRLTQTEG